MPGTTWVKEIVRQVLYRDNQEWLNMSQAFTFNLIFLGYGTGKLL